MTTRKNDPNGTIVRKDFVLKVLLTIVGFLLGFGIWQMADWRGNVDSALASKVDKSDYRREVDEMKGQLKDIHDGVDEVKTLIMRTHR